MAVEIKKEAIICQSDYFNDVIVRIDSEGDLVIKQGSETVFIKDPQELIDAINAVAFGA